MAATHFGALHWWQAVSDSGFLNVQSLHAHVFWLLASLGFPDAQIWHFAAESGFTNVHLGHAHFLSIALGQAQSPKGCATIDTRRASNFRISKQSSPLLVLLCREGSRVGCYTGFLVVCFCLLRALFMRESRI